MQALLPLMRTMRLRRILIAFYFYTRHGKRLHGAAAASARGHQVLVRVRVRVRFYERTGADDGRVDTRRVEVGVTVRWSTCIGDVSGQKVLLQTTRGTNCDASSGKKRLQCTVTKPTK